MFAIIATLNDKLNTTVSSIREVPLCLARTASSSAATSRKTCASWKRAWEKSWQASRILTGSKGLMYFTSLCKLSNLLYS